MRVASEIRGTLEITDLEVQAGESFKDERIVNMKSVPERDQERGDLHVSTRLGSLEVSPWWPRWELHQVKGEPGCER